MLIARDMYIVRERIAFIVDDLIMHFIHCQPLKYTFSMAWQGEKGKGKSYKRWKIKFHWFHRNSQFGWFLFVKLHIQLKFATSKTYPTDNNVCLICPAWLCGNCVCVSEL